MGLGNPGSEYRNSRHNVGFMVIDELSHRWSIELKQHKFQGLFGKGRFGIQQVMLLKPQTYMNRSGLSVAEALTFYKILLDDVLVVVDDMALELARIRLRSQGSPGGHHGLQDIIDHAGTDEFARLRIGIGPSPAGRATDHVLGDFFPEEQPTMAAAIHNAADAVEVWLQAGIDETMNRFNRQPDE